MLKFVYKFFLNHLIGKRNARRIRLLPKGTLIDKTVKVECLEYEKIVNKLYF